MVIYYSMNRDINYNIKVNDGNSIQTISQLEAEVEGLNSALKFVEPNSEQFKTLSKEVQGATKKLQALNKEVEGISLEDKLQVADGAIKTLAGSTQALIGGFGLLGIESESLDFLEGKAAEAIAFGMGLKDLSEGVGQLAPAFKKGGIAANLFGATTRKALISTGVLAFVAVLGTIIAYWDEITDFIKGTTTELERQQKVYDELNTASQTAVDLLRMEYDNAVLRGESAVGLSIEIQKQLLLQQEQNKLLLEALELDLARNQAENKSVTTWEKIKIGASGFLGIGAQAKVIAESISSESDETNDLQNKITDAKKRALDLDRQLLLIGKQINEEKRFEEFQSREPEQKLEIATIGLTDANKDKLKSDADFNRLLIYEKTKADDEYTAAVLENQMKLDEARTNALDNLIYIAGAETKVGRALLIAKQAMVAKELLLDIKRTITFAKQTLLRSSAASAEGVAQTAKVGFPQNIPLLIGYAAQAVSIIGAVKAATSKAGSSGISVQTPRVPSSSPARPRQQSQGVQPIDLAAQQIQNQGPIMAYTLSGNVRDASEADAKIKAKRSVG